MDGLGTLSEQSVDAALIVLKAAVLASAAHSDHRTRHAADTHWRILCVVGIPLAAAGIWMTSGVWAALSYSVGSLLLAAYMLTSVDGLRAVPLVTAGAILCAMPAVVLGTDPGLLTAPMVFLIVLAMYRVRLLPGGADAKCLMTLALVLPTHPETSVTPLLWHPGLPGSAVFAPAMCVLMLSLVLALLWTVPVVIRNVRAGKIDRGMFTSFGIGLDKADPDFHWPVETIQNGELVGCRASPDTAAETLELLRRSGIREARVSPSVPFLVPLSAAFLAVVILGFPIGARCSARRRTSCSGPRPARTGPPGTPGA